MAAIMPGKPSKIWLPCAVATALCGVAAPSFARPPQAGPVSSGVPGPEPGPVTVQPGPPGAPSTRLAPSTYAAPLKTSQADIEFMQGMIMHHTQAVVMTALIPSHTENQAVRRLGARISLSQSDEIKFMSQWLIARGEAASMAMPGMPDMDMNGKPMAPMPGMLTPAQMDALGKARGAEFDRLFLTGMIQHHGGALVMVKNLFDTPGAGQVADLFDFATDVDNSQRAEIRIMQNLLKEIR